MFFTNPYVAAFFLLSGLLFLVVAYLRRSEGLAHVILLVGVALVLLSFVVIYVIDRVNGLTGFMIIPVAISMGGFGLGTLAVVAMFVQQLLRQNK